MNRRRFLALVGVLVGLNLFLWLVPAGMALRQAVIGQLFGPRMIRAEVIVQNGTSTLDYLVDRGVVVSTSATTLVIREQDGRVQTIPVSSDTRVLGPPRFSNVTLLKPNFRVLVLRQANAPAELVQLEGRGPLP